MTKLAHTRSYALTVGSLSAVIATDEQGRPGAVKFVGTVDGEPYEIECPAILVEQAAAILADVRRDAGLFQFCETHGYYIREGYKYECPACLAAKGAAPEPIEREPIEREPTTAEHGTA